MVRELVRYDSHAGLIHGSVPYYMYVGSWSVRVSGRCSSVFEFFVSTPQFERGRFVSFRGLVRTSVHQGFGSGFG